MKTRRFIFLYRFFAGLIIFSLILPPQSALALRVQQPESSSQTVAGLKEKLNLSPTQNSQPTTASNSGLEEGQSLRSRAGAIPVGSIVQVYLKSKLSGGGGWIVVAKEQALEGFIPARFMSSLRGKAGEKVSSGDTFLARVIVNKIRDNRIDLVFVPWDEAMRQRFAVMEGLHQGQEIEFTPNQSNQFGLSGFYEDSVPVFVPMNVVSQYIPKRQRPRDAEWANWRVTGTIGEISHGSVSLILNSIWLVPHGGLEESLRAVLTGPQQRIVSVAISPSSAQVIAGTDAPDYHLHRWNLSSGDSQSQSEKNGLNTVIQYRPDGKNLVTGNKLGALFGWNAEYGTQLWKKTSRDTGAHQAAILAIRMARNGSDVVVADQDGMVKQWTISGGVSQNSTNIPQMVNTTHLDLLDERMLLFVQKEQVAVWTRDDATAPFKEFKKLNKKGVVQAFFHPNGQSVVTVDKVGAIEQWNLTDTKLMGTFRNGSQPLQQILWNGAGDQLIGVTSSGEIIFWNTLTQQKIKSVNNPSGSVVAMAADPYGRSLAVAGADNQVRLWDLPDPVPADVSEIETVKPVHRSTASDFDILEFFEAHSGDFLEGFSRVWGTKEPFQRERLKKWILRYRNVSESPLVERVLDALQNLSDSRWISENQPPVKDLFILPLSQSGSFWKLPTPEEPEYFAISLELLQQADLRLLLYLLETGDEAPLQAWAAEQVKPSKSALDEVLGKELKKEKPKVVPAPKITKQPASVSLTEGGNAAFSVDADGKELRYQWYRNNKLIDGETDKTLNIRDAKPSDAGTIHAEASNSGGTVSSNEVQLIVAAVTRTVKAAPPEMTNKPRNVTLVRNRSGQIEQDAVFSVTAKGEGVSYQWRFQGEDGGYKDIEGATESTYTIPAAELTKERAGRYRVVMTNAGGQVTASAMLTLKDPPPLPKTPPSSSSGSVSADFSAPVSAVAREVRHQIAQAAQRSTGKGLGDNRMVVENTALTGHRFRISWNTSGASVRAQVVPIQSTFLGGRKNAVFFPDPRLTDFPDPAWVSSVETDEVLNREGKNKPIQKLSDSMQKVWIARDNKKPVAAWLAPAQSDQIQADLQSVVPLIADNGQTIAQYLSLWAADPQSGRSSERRNAIAVINQALAHEIEWMHRLAGYRQRWQALADGENNISVTDIENDLTEIARDLSGFPQASRLARDLNVDAKRAGSTLSVDPLWRLTDRISDELRLYWARHLLGTVASDDLSGSYYLGVGLALESHYRQMAASAGTYTAWEWAGMADMVLCWHQEYSIALTVRAKAKPLDGTRRIVSVIDPAGGVLWLKGNSSDPVRFDEGAYAVSTSNGLGLQFHPVLSLRGRQSPDEQPVLVIHTLTGLPTVDQLEDYAALLETMRIEMPNETVPWLAAVHTETGEIRVLKPTRLPSDTEEWNRFREALSVNSERALSFYRLVARAINQPAIRLLGATLVLSGRMGTGVGVDVAVANIGTTRAKTKQVAGKDVKESHTALVTNLAQLLTTSLSAIYSNGNAAVVSWVMGKMQRAVQALGHITEGNIAVKADAEILPVLLETVELASERESAPIVSNPEFFILVPIAGFSQSNFPAEMNPWLVSRGVAVPVDATTQRIQREISQAALNSTQPGLRPNRFLSDSGGLIGQRLVMGVNMAGNTGYRAHMVPWNISPLGGRVYTSLFPDPNMDDSPFPHTAWVAFFEIKDFLGLERRSKQTKALINSLDKIGQAQKAGKPMDQWISPDLPKEIQQNASEMFLETDAQENKASVQVEKWLTGKSAISRADKQQAIDEIAVVLNDEIAVMHSLAVLRTEWQKIASGNNQRVPFSRVEQDMKPILDGFQQMPIAREMLEGLLSVFRQQGESVSVQDLWFVPYMVSDQLRAYRLWRFMPRVPAQVLSEIYYAVVWMNYERHLRVMKENPGNYSDWDWVGMADTILSLYREHLMSEAAAQRAQPFPTRRIAQVLDPIGGVLFLDKNGKPLRFEEGAGAVKSVNNPGAQFNPVAYQSSLPNPDEQPVIVINTLTGLPAVEHLEMYFSLIKDMQAGLPNRKIPWLAVAHSETGQVRIFKPLHLPGAEGWNQFNEALDGAAVRSAAFRSGVRTEVAEPVKTYEAEAQRARGLRDREDARRRGAGFTSMTKAITDAAKEAAYRQLVPGLPGLVERNLSAAYDQSPGERSPWLLGRLAEGFERVRTEVTLDTMNTNPEDVIPPVLREAETLIAETEGASLVSNPEFFEPVSIFGLTTEEFPEEMDPWLAVHSVVSSAPGQQAITAKQLQKTLVQRAGDALQRPLLLPGQLIYVPESDVVGVDLNGAPALGVPFIEVDVFVDSRSLANFPLVPSGKWLGHPEPLPSRYRMQTGAADILALAASRNPEFTAFHEALTQAKEADPPQREHLQAAVQRLLDWERQHRSMESLKADYPDSVPDLEKTEQIVGENSDALVHLYSVLEPILVSLRSEAVLSSDEAAQALSNLKSVSGWPWVTQVIDAFSQQLQPGTPAATEFLRTAVVQIAFAAQQETFLRVANAIPSEVLQAAYYPAVLSWLTRQDLSSQEVLESIQSIELHMAMTDEMIRTVAPISADQPVTRAYESGLGICCIGPDKKIRWAPGGLHRRNSKIAAASFDLEAAQNWIRPGDTVILFYGSMTGYFSGTQLPELLRDVWHLQSRFPGQRIQVGAASKDGTVWLFDVPRVEDQPALWLKAIGDAYRLKEQANGFRDAVLQNMGGVETLNRLTALDSETLPARETVQMAYGLVRDFSGHVEQVFQTHLPASSKFRDNPVRKQGTSLVFASLVDASTQSYFAKAIQALFPGTVLGTTKSRPGKGAAKEQYRQGLISMMRTAAALPGWAEWSAHVGKEGVAEQWVDSGGFLTKVAPETVWGESSTGNRSEEQIQERLADLVDKAVKNQNWAGTRRAEAEQFAQEEWRKTESVNGVAVSELLLTGGEIKQSDFNKALRVWLTRKDAADALAAKQTAVQLAAANQRVLDEQQVRNAANQTTADEAVAALEKVSPADVAAVVAALSTASETARSLPGEFAVAVAQAIQKLSQQAVDALTARGIEANSPEVVQANLTDLEKLSTAVSVVAGEGKWTATLAETKTAWMAAGPAAAVQEIQQLYDQLFQPEPPPIEAEAVERWQKWTAALPPELSSTRETLQQLRVIHFYERLPYLADIVAGDAPKRDAFLSEIRSLLKEKLPEVERNWILIALGRESLGVADAVEQMPAESEEQWKWLITYLPVFDGITALVLEQLKGQENIVLQWYSVMRERRHGMQSLVETMARRRAIDRANATPNGRLTDIRPQPLSVGQELVFTHKHSGRQIRFLFDQIKRPAPRVDVAVFKTRTSPGQVILPVNKLKHAQETKDDRGMGNGWRDGGIAPFLRKHDHEMHGVFGPVSFEMDSRIDRRPDFLNSLIWVFPFELVVDVSRPDSGVTLEHRPKESDDAKVLVDYYPNLALRTVPFGAGSASSDKIIVQIDDSLDLWESKVVPAAGLEETISERAFKSSYGQGEPSFRSREIGGADRPLGPNRNISFIPTVDMQEFVVALSGGADYTGPEWVQVPLQTPPLHPFVPAPSELNREQYSVRINLKDFYQRVSARNGHYLPLFGLISQERIIKEFSAGGAALRTWALETITAARDLLTHGQAEEDLQSRLHTRRQESPELFARMEQENQRQENWYREYYSRISQIGKELKALEDAGQNVTHRQAEEKLQSLLPFLEHWPELQLSLRAFLWGLHPAPSNKIAIVQLQDSLTSISEGVRQAIRVQVSRQASIPQRAFAVYDLTREAVLERLQALEQQINLAENEDASLGDWAQEVVVYSRRALDLESEQVFTELVYQAAPLADPVARIPDFPVQGGGLLLLDSNRRPKDFIEGMGVSSDEDLSPRYSSGRTIDWLKARYKPGDTVVITYPSARGYPTLEQLSGFLNDLASFRQQLNPAAQVWMAAVVDGVGEHPASFWLYRPNIPSENWEPEWMLLRSTVETRGLGLTNLIQSFYANGLMERINHNIRHYYEIGQRSDGEMGLSEKQQAVAQVTNLIQRDLQELRDQLSTGFDRAYGSNTRAQVQDWMEETLKDQFNRIVQHAGPDEVNHRFPALFRWMDEFFQEWLAMSVVTNSRLFSPAYIDGLTKMDDVDKQVKKLVDLRGNIKPAAPSEAELRPFARWWVVDQYNSGKLADHKGFPTVWKAFVAQRDALSASGRQLLESRDISLEWLGEVHDFLDEVLKIRPLIQGNTEAAASLTGLAGQLSNHAYDLLLGRAESLSSGSPAIEQIDQQLQWMEMATDLFIDRSYDDLVGEKWRDRAYAQRYREAHQQVLTQKEEYPLVEYTQEIREHGVGLAPGETLVIRLPRLPGSSEPREISVRYQGPLAGSGSDGRAQFEVSYPSDQALAPGRLMGAQVDRLEVVPLGTFVADVREAAASSAPDLPRLLNTVMQPPMGNPRTVSERLQSRAVFYPFPDLARLLSEDPFRSGLAVNGNLTKMFDQAPFEIVLREHDHEGEVAILSVVEREGAPPLLFYVLAAGQEEKTMSVEQFREEYGKFFSTTDPLYLADKKELGANSVTVIPLTGKLPLYVQGSTLLEAVQDEFPRKQYGDRFAPELIGQTTQWQRIGLVLKDEASNELPLNPNALPIRDSSADKIRDLDPVELLLEIFKSRLPPGSVHMGEMLLTDQSGQTYLVLLSA